MAILFPPGDDRDLVTLAGSTFALAGRSGKMGLVRSDGVELSVVK
jgi:hypothetical protein